MTGGLEYMGDYEEGTRITVYVMSIGALLIVVNE